MLPSPTPGLYVCINGKMHRQVNSTFTPFTLINACCVAEPLAGVAFAFQSGPVIGPKLGPVPHYSTSRNIGHCGVFSTSTTAIGNTIVSFMKHPVRGEVVICVTVKYCHFLSGIILPYGQGSQDSKLFSPHFSFCYGL